MNLLIVFYSIIHIITPDVIIATGRFFHEDCLYYVLFKFTCTTFKNNFNKLKPELLS